MIVKTTIVENLIKFSGNDVQVTRFSDEGEVTLQVKYEIDLRRALRSGVTIVEIQIQKPYNDSRKQVRSPNEALDAIRFRARDNQERANKKQQSILYSRKSDITKQISNSNASKITTSIGAVVLGTESVIESVPTQNFAKKLKTIPVLQTPVSRKDDFAHGNRSSQQMSRDMILRQGISPAAYINPATSFITTEEALQGVTPTRRLNSATDVNEGSLIRSYLGDILDIDTAASLGRTDTVPIQSRRTKNKAVVVETLTFTKALYARKGARVFVTISALDASGLQISTQRALIDLSQKEARWNAVNALESSPGKTALRFPNIAGTMNVNEDNLDTTDISIYKIQSDVYKAPRKKKLFDDTNTEPTIGDTQGIGRSGANDQVDVWIKKKSGAIHSSGDGSWVKLKRLYTGNLPEIAIQSMLKSERQSLSSTTIARFISKKSSDFVDLVYPGVYNNLASTNSFLGPHAVAETDVKFSAVTAFLKQGRIAIYVSGLEIEGTVMIVRRDLTLNETAYTSLDISEPVKLIAPDSRAIVFEDTSIKSSHVYEYRAKAFTRHGRAIMTTGSAIIEYKPLNGNSVEVTIGDPTASVDRSGVLDVSFDIKGIAPETSLSLINAILEDANLAKYFEANIESSREKLSSLIAFSIERVDMKTGSVESFGIIKSGTFSDKLNQKMNNVSSLKSGRKYRYIISACLREPDTLIDSATRTSIDKATGRSYTFSPSKFLNPNALTRGVIPSTDQAASTDVRSAFNAGFAGVQKIVDITTSEQRPAVISASIKQIAKTQTSIRWKVKGSVSAFDHFVIIGKKLGMSYIVGKHHNAGVNGSFEFIDKVSSKQTGEVTYTIVPVYSDYARGVPVKAGRMTGLSTSRVKK